MLDWGYIFGKLISAIGSWLDAANLRNEVYRLKDQHELMYTALEDIQRMDPEGRMGWYAKQTLDLVNGKDNV